MHKPLFLEVDSNGRSGLINVNAIVSIGPSRDDADTCVIRKN